MKLAPKKHQTPVVVGRNESIKVHFGHYADFDPLTRKLIIKCRGSNTIMCMHPLGKTEFILNKENSKRLLDSIGSKFEEIEQ